MQTSQERMTLFGEENLSLRELLSLLIAKKDSLSIAGNVLREFGSVEKIKNASITELSKIKGIGKTVACRLKASLEIASRMKIQNLPNYKPMIQARDVFEFCNPWFSMEQEMFLVLALNVKQQVIRLFRIAKGTMISCPVHPREVFKPLIKEGAISFIVAHNHPSSLDPKPSQKDLDLTEKLVETGKLLGIPLLDHVIVGGIRFVSLKEMGMI